MKHFTVESGDYVATDQTGLTPTVGHRDAFTCAKSRLCYTVYI